MRVLLVEDHELLRAGLRILCERRPQWKVVGEASACSVALDLVQSAQPDILLLDLMLADGSALDCLPRLRELFGGGIVILTGDEDPDVHRLALENGADAIVLKGAEPEFLFAEVERVTQEKRPSPPANPGASAATSPPHAASAVAERKVA